MHKIQPRRIYYRKKNRSIIIEGKENNKSINIWTLPEPQEFLASLIEKTSFFTKEKSEKILEKIRRLDIKTNKPKKTNKELHTTNIMRTSEKDAVEEEIEDETEEDYFVGINEKKKIAEIGDLL